jgi:membrane-bound acyltransferase YfiQ involved in biofilm formation
MSTLSLTEGASPHRRMSARANFMETTRILSRPKGNPYLDSPMPVTLYFCVDYLCLIGWVYVFYLGHVDRIDYMKPFSILYLFYVNIIIIALICMNEWILNIPWNYDKYIHMGIQMYVSMYISAYIWKMVFGLCCAILSK